MDTRLRGYDNFSSCGCLLQIIHGFCKMKTYYVYILASRKNGTLYIGVTNDLQRRVWQHRNEAHEGFTKRYQAQRLVWYESAYDVEGAIRREKQMKKWRRQWKINLIEEENPEWLDLYDTLG